MRHMKTLSALCLILLMACAFLFGCSTDAPAPHPDKVQVVNPLMQVSSLEEMETYLDFSVPILDKDVESYIVLVIDGYPTMGRILYADGGVFSIQYGTGDISGVYGGTLEKEENIGNAHVTYYQYEDTRYAIWECDGFTHSLSGGKLLEQELSELLLTYVPWKQ